MHQERGTRETRRKKTPVISPECDTSVSPKSSFDDLITVRLTVCSLKALNFDNMYLE